jgi:glycine/D-amino acid oxidase-like deaminating enzyme
MSPGMRRSPSDVLVLGAGLQGTGVALELARRGLDVTLVDRDPCPLNRASLRNEGKIHLGFIYANDGTLGTALLMLDGALRFRSILARWIDRVETIPCSTPFHYLVAADSIVAPARLAQHYAAVGEHALQRLEQDPELDYLGQRPRCFACPLTEERIAAHFDPTRFAGGFATAERAVDTHALAERLRAAVAESARVTFLPSRWVRAITEHSDGFHVDGEWSGDGERREGTWRLHASQVVNATWEHRLALDRQLGLAPPDHLLHRLKFRVIARLPRELRAAPSVSMVLGRYGDLVVRPDGTAYLSWYPAALKGWSHDLEPPTEWDPPCRGEVPPDLARDIVAGVLAGMDSWCPGIARCEPLIVDAGVIVAIGRSDVDDATSGLHDRSRIGVTSRGGYHSVDPGKLTTAPRFALEAADRVEAFRGASRAAS